MKLLYDEYDEIYVWVNTADEDQEYSPMFDTPEDAQEWYDTMKKIFRGNK